MKRLLACITVAAAVASACGSGSTASRADASPTASPQPSEAATVSQSAAPIQSAAPTRTPLALPTVTPTPAPSFRAPTAAEWKALVDHPEKYTGEKHLVLWGCVDQPTGYIGPMNFAAIAYRSRVANIGKVGWEMGFDGDTSVLGDLPVKTLVSMRVTFEMANPYNTVGSGSGPTHQAQFNVASLNRAGTCSY